MILWAGSAFAQDMAGHPPHDQAIHERFYSTWMMPDNRTVPCCHNIDCSPAESHFENDHWVARKLGDPGGFTVIPDQKIEHERDNPDGRSHLCGGGKGSAMTVYCFINGMGT